MATRIITSKRPEVQRKQAVYSVPRERADRRTWTLQEELKAFKQTQDIPAEAEMVENTNIYEDLIEYRYTWWEVTL